MWNINTNKLRLSPRMIGVLLAILVTVLIVFVGIRALRFHMVTISPGLKSIGSTTPYIDFKYNKALSDIYEVSAAPAMIKSSEVDGKNLRLFINSDDVVVGTKYKITFKSVSSKSGDRIVNKSYEFTAKDVKYNDLSAEQKSYVVSQQDKFIFSRTTILLIGADALIDRGVSDSQIVVLQQAVFAYSKSINKQFAQVTINSAGLTQAPYDSSSSNPLSILDFDVVIDDQAYHFKLTSSGFTTAQLQIYDKSGGTQLFDSGLLEPVSD